MILASAYCRNTTYTPKGLKEMFVPLAQGRTHYLLEAIPHKLRTKAHIIDWHKYGKRYKIEDVRHHSITNET